MEWSDWKRASRHSVTDSIGERLFDILGPISNLDFMGAGRVSTNEWWEIREHRMRDGKPEHRWPIPNKRFKTRRGAVGALRREK